MWLADTPELRARRASWASPTPVLGGAAAMVFVFAGDTTAGFWMKDTPLPLSIAWYPPTARWCRPPTWSPCPDGTADCPVYAARRALPLRRGGSPGALDGLGLVEGSTIALGSTVHARAHG